MNHSSIQSSAPSSLKTVLGQREPLIPVDPPSPVADVLVAILRLMFGRVFEAEFWS